jgi:hypothetical protein
MDSYQQFDNIQKLAAEARIRLSAAPTPGYSDAVTFDGHVRTENGVREAAFAGLRSDSMFGLRQKSELILVPRIAAILTRSATDFAPIFLMACPRCIFTVGSLHSRTTGKG